MSRTARFDALWQEAHDREYPVLQEAARLQREDPALEGDPVTLFHLAARMCAASASFSDCPSFIDSGPDPFHVAAMLQLLG